MVKKYLALVPLALSNLSFGMKQAIEQGPEEQEQVLEQLRKEPTSLMNFLPRELINELQHFADDQIRQAIESSKSIQEAIERLKRLADLKIHARYFKDLKSIESIINALAIRFAKSPDKVARQLNMEGFEGAQRWLEDVRPGQLQFFDAIERRDMNAIGQLISQHDTP